MDYRPFQRFLGWWSVSFRKYIWFSFVPLIQSELIKIKSEWNKQFLLKSRHNTVSGIPDVLYFLPQGVGYQDQVITVTGTEISDMIQKADLNMDQERSSCAVDLALQSYFDYVVQNENMAYPSNN